MTATADAVVVGGGSTGCSIAYHLASRGLKVLLVERKRVASGSTGSSPAIIRQYYDDPILSLLARESLLYFLRWKEEVGGDCGFVRTGFLTGAAGFHAEHMAVNVGLRREQGIQLDFLTPSEMQQLQPAMIADALGGGAYEPEAGYCDPVATTSTLVAAFRRHGGTIIEGQSVTRIRVFRGRVLGVDTSRGPIDAPVVVNAAGPWAAHLARTAGSQLPIRVSRHAVTVLGLTTSGLLHDQVGYAELVNRFYLRPDRHRRCIIGSLDINDSIDTDPDACDPVVGYEAAARHRERAAARFRRLVGAPIHYGWASFFDDTPDGNPIVGQDPEVTGSFVAAGMSGHGFKLCPVLGLGVAKLIISGRTGLPIEHFSPSRFFPGTTEDRCRRQRQSSVEVSSGAK